MARIFIASNSSWNLFNFRLELIKSLLEDGHQIMCLSPSDDYDIKLTTLGVKHLNISLSRSSMNPFRDLFTLLNYMVLFLYHRPDYFLAFTVKPNIYGGLTSRLFRVKSIHNISGLGYSFIRNGWLSNFVSYLYRLALSSAHHVFFQNGDDKKLFIDAGICQARQASVLPGSGVDTTFFHPSKRAKKRKLFRFLMVSRLLVDKGVREYVAAAEALASASDAYAFFLVGSRDKGNPSSISKAELERWIASGIITYRDHTDDIRSVYASSDCIVLPSYREGAPRTLIEAGAMGLPAIATAVPGCRSVVQDQKTGLLVNMQDVADLKEKMQAIYDMEPDKFKHMQIAARKHIVDAFCVTKIIASYRQQITRPTMETE